jgi:hypothetical protein
MKLTLRFVVLIAASVAASATCGVWALQRSQAATTRMVANDMARLLALAHAQRLFGSLHALERDYLLATGAAQRVRMDASMESLAVQLQDQLNKYALLMPSDDAPLLAQLGEASARWYALDERVRSAAQRDQAEAAALSAQHGLDAASWDNASEALAKLNEARLASQAAHTNGMYRTAESQLAAGSAFAALLAGLFGHVLLARIRRQLAPRVQYHANLDVPDWRVAASAGPSHTNPYRARSPAASAQPPAATRNAPQARSNPVPRPRRLGAFR